MAEFVLHVPGPGKGFGDLEPAQFTEPPAQAGGRLRDGPHREAGLPGHPGVRDGLGIAEQARASRWVR